MSWTELKNVLARNILLHTVKNLAEIKSQIYSHLSLSSPWTVFLGQEENLLESYLGMKTQLPTGGEGGSSNPPLETSLVLMP